MEYLRCATPTQLRELALPGLPFSVSRLVSRPRELGLAFDRFLKSRSRLEQIELWRGVTEWVQRCGLKSELRMLSRSDVRALGDGVHLGAHSYEHDTMTFETDAYFQSDFSRRRAYFEERLGLGLNTYAFPNGCYRSPIVDFLASEGVKYVLLVDERRTRGDGPGSPASPTMATRPVSCGCGLSV